MRVVHIREKLAELGVEASSIVMGDFDQIGELTARKPRQPGSDGYRKYGALFRPNYERGILIDALIRHFGMKSMLEIGFGRGYATMCAARAFHDTGGGEIVTIDPVVNDQHMQIIAEAFPSEWLKQVEFMKGKSQGALEQLGDRRFDLIYVDGDHTREAVQADWEMTRDRYDRCLLFDDYHLPGKDSGPGIQVAEVIDVIDWKKEGCKEPELILMDRRIFVDDRRIPDSEIDYGQVLLSRES